MTHEIENPDQQPERALYGRVLGILEDRDQLKSLSASITDVAPTEVEVLDGSAGIARLEEWKDETSQYFFGDMEGDMLQRYLDAAKGDLTVFSIVVDSDAASDVAQKCKANGAVQITHFGNSAITDY